MGWSPPPVTVSGPYTEKTGKRKNGGPRGRSLEGGVEVRDTAGRLRRWRRRSFLSFGGTGAGRWAPRAPAMGVCPAQPHAAAPLEQTGGAAASGSNRSQVTASGGGAHPAALLALARWVARRWERDHHGRSCPQRQGGGWGGEGGFVAAVPHGRMRRFPHAHHTAAPISYSTCPPALATLIQLGTGRYWHPTWWRILWAVGGGRCCA